MKRINEDAVARRNAEKILQALFTEELPEELRQKIRHWFFDETQEEIKREVLGELFVEMVREQDPRIASQEAEKLCLRTIHQLLFSHQSVEQLERSLKNRRHLHPEVPIREEVALPENFPKKFSPQSYPLSETFQEYSQPTTIVRMNWRRYVVRISAVLLLCLAIGGGMKMMWLKRCDGTIERSAEKQLTIEVPEHRYRQVVLPDGTEVVLNQQSLLCYRGARIVYLKGEAFFKVHPDRIPFRVETDQLQVTVLGTEFNCKAYPEVDSSVVTLYAGSLMVEDANNRLTLTPGKELIFHAGTGEVRLNNAVQGAVQGKPRWLSSILNFEGRALSDIFHSLEAYYGVSMQYDSTLNLDQHYSFRLVGDEKLEEVLYVLQRVSGEFTYAIEENKIIIQSRHE